MEHAEPPARIDPEVAHTAAQLEEEERWATHVERRLAAAPRGAQLAAPGATWAAAPDEAPSEAPVPGEPYAARYAPADAEERLVLLEFAQLLLGRLQRGVCLHLGFKPPLLEQATNR